MEKIMFMPEGSDKPASFYVLEQTKIRGFSYILVTDREEGDAECLILKEKSKSEGEDALYVDRRGRSGTSGRIEGV